MNVFGTLLLWRLRFYAITTMALLHRRSQAVLFLLFLLAPASAPFLVQIRLLSTPLLALIHSRNPLHSVAIWFGILLTFVVWSGIQNKSVRGGEAQVFLDLQALSPRLSLWLDICVLTIIDIPILIPFIATFLISANDFPFFEAAEQALLIASLLISAILLQTWLLRGARHVFMLAASSFIGPLLISLPYFPYIPAMATLPVLVMAYVTPKFAERMQGHPRITARDTLLLLRLNTCSNLQTNLLRLSLRYLFGGEELANRLGLLICSLMPTLLLYNVGLRPPVMIAFLILLLALLVFQLGGLTFALRKFHTPMISYLRAHGLVEYDFDRSLMLTLFVVNLVVCLPLFISLCFLSGWLQAASVFPLTLAGTIVLRHSSCAGKKFSLVIKVALIAVIAVLAWLLFSIH